MNIRKSCQSWAKAMESFSPKAIRTIENIRTDPCIGDRAEADFFGLVAASWTSDASDPLETATKVVRRDLDAFTCTGIPVPKDLLVALMRLEDISSLRYRTPELLDSLGFTDAQLRPDSLSDDELRSLTDEYDGPVEFGNNLDIVWVTDFDEATASLASHSLLRDRLGLPAAVSIDRCVLCVYNRSAASKPLHVPRALDAIGQELFQPNTDCEAKTGMTSPTDSGTQGLPEAVHRGCTLTPTRWELLVA